MSKGHLEALAALKALRDKSTRLVRLRVPPMAAAAKPETVTQPQAETVKTVTRGGRGKKVHASVAEKQKAYRARKKAQG